MEGAVVGGLVAKEESELALLIAQRKIVGHSDVLEALGALAEPVMLRHFLDQESFGHGGGLVFGAKAAEEVVEFVLVFGRQDGEGAAGEAVAEIVEAGGGFTGFGLRSGGELRVFLVGGDLDVSGHGGVFAP